MAIERGKVITVERGGGRPSAGQGLLKSMAVVWDHWRSSFRKNQGFGDIRGTFTVQYPEERLTLPQTYRNMPILLYDDATGHELCTSCFQCQRICPPQVIHMTQAKDPATGKAVPAVTEFVIEYDACMSCGFCAEVCPFDAIKMDHAFELSTADHPSLTVHKEALNRPISYYAEIAPDLWAEARDGALKKLQGNIKRRPDVIGMAPQLAEKIAARRRELAAAGETRGQGDKGAGVAPAPVQARALTPEEKAAKLAAIRAKNAAAAPVDAPAPAAEAAPADEKAAKLAAIRAANAAKKAGEGAPAAGAAEAAPADEKAAKLAAIRAANAAKKAGGQGEAALTTTDSEGRVAPAPEAQAAAAAEAPEAAAASPEALVDPASEIPSPATRAEVATPEAATAGAAPPVPPPNTAPADDKAARLAAIRAANAAKKAAEQGGDGGARGGEGGQ